MKDFIFSCVEILIGGILGLAVGVYISRPKEDPKLLEIIELVKNNTPPLYDKELQRILELLKNNQEIIETHSKNVSDTTNKFFIDTKGELSLYLKQNKNLTDKIDTLNATHESLDTILHLYDDTTKLTDVMGYVVEKLHREGKIAQAQSLYLMWNELLPELYID